MAKNRFYGRPWAPRADVYETQQHVSIVLDIPGMKAEDIDVQCEKGMLSIKGERSLPGDGTERKYYRVENVYGPFERYFEIPSTLDVTTIDAKYQDGMLILTLPKVEEVKPKKVEIKISE